MYTICKIQVDKSIYKTHILGFLCNTEELQIGNRN